MIKLDIFSDPVCPWCYIGKARLDRALAARPDHPFEIEWHPFQLNPEMPPGGMDRTEYLETKFGGKEGVLRTYGPVVDEAEEAGLKLNLSAITRQPNTLDAHRLIHWAGLEGRQNAAVSALFRAYFVDGRDIGDRAALAAIGEGLEMDRTMLDRLFAGDADQQEIRSRDAHARERGVRAVPTFVVGNRHAVSGAQPPELWMQVIDELAEQQHR